MPQSINLISGSVEFWTKHQSVGLGTKPGEPCGADQSMRLSRAAIYLAIALASLAASSGSAARTVTVALR